ncbi:MAG: hypothetical protein JJ920_11130 [Roseitalea sp.]|jgi:hypothetical protein|nr:hypothetical protein [Roseitalea sp.]MBO6722018.1 hypothetical protein [Roseitalea sp.]MBO6743456.1 hypothetical protein [Roseitalea sp.]
MAAMLLAGTIPAASGPRHDAAIDRGAAEQVAQRMGTIRGSMDLDAALVTATDVFHTHSVEHATPTVLPALTPFSGPAFALFHEPVARQIPDRPVRIVYGGSLLVAATQDW